MSDRMTQREAVEPGLREALGRMIADLRLTGPTRDENCSRSVLANELAALLTDAPARQRDAESDLQKTQIALSLVERTKTYEQIIAWLMGEAPDPLDGIWMGDEKGAGASPWWWRTKLNELRIVARQRDGSPRRDIGEAAMILRIAEAYRTSDGVEYAYDYLKSALAAPPPDSAPASGETRVTEEMVARAICTARRGNPDEVLNWGGQRLWEKYKQEARAVLAIPSLASIQPTPATGVDRAGVLAAAIQYAIDHRDIDWLTAWNEGDPEAMADLARALQPTAAAKPRSEGER